MSNKSPQDYSEKKKNRPHSFKNTQIALQALVIIVGSVAGNQAHAIIKEIAKAISELGPITINPANLLLFIIFSMLLLSLLRIIWDSPEENILLEEADEIIQQLEEPQTNRLADSIKDETEHSELDNSGSDSSDQQQMSQ